MSLGEGGKTPLNANQRLKVAIDIAQGLDYLHSFAVRHSLWPYDINQWYGWIHL